MICLFMHLKNYYSIGNAFALSLGIVVFLLAFIPTMWLIVCNSSTKIRVFTFQFLASLTAFFTGLDFLSDHDDDLTMPLEYVEWASAKKWRESCVRTGERRM